MQPAANSWRTRSSASIVSCAVSVGKPYIRYACTMMPASVNARVTRATCSTVTPFFMRSSSRSDATSSPPLTATQPDSASSAQSSGVNVFSKRMLPHQVIAELVGDEPLRERAQPGGRRGLVDEVKARLAGLRDQRAIRCTTTSALGRS